MGIRLLIADDHNLFREGLVTLLSSFPDFQVIGEAADGTEAIFRAKQLEPDIVIMDISMPGMNGIEATSILKKDCPGIKVITLSMHSDRKLVKAMLEADADGYLLKSCTCDQLVDAVNAITSGKKYLSDEITEMVIKGYLEPPDADDKAFSELTEREIAILKLFAEGESTREIADKLFISIKTVGTHKIHIYKKLGFKNNSDLVRFAIKKGFLQL